MAKPDGRIEKGQRLSTAISARAWNRAQDAADIVLGVRPGFSVPQSTSQLDHIIVRVPTTYFRVDTNPLQVGDGISLPVSSVASRLLSQANNPTGSPTALQVDAESDIPQYDASTVSCITLPNSQENFIGARCGLIESVSEEQEGHFTCRVRVRGLVRCRVLLLQPGNFVSPPPVYPQNASLQPFWRRYLMASDYGQGAILSIGAHYRLTESAAFPSIAEALVLLG
jgi:hypothetical protein